METIDAALAASRQVVAGRNGYGVARASTAFHEAIVQTADNELMLKMMRTISGRMVWLFYLTSDLEFDDAFHDHAQLRDAVAAGNEGLAEAVMYGHIERDRVPSFDELARRARHPAR